jgi:dihydrofolate reductase
LPVAKLFYTAIASLDGCVADERGNFDWAQPDEEVHAFVNDLERSVGTFLYGRRMYEVLLAWETLELGDEPSQIRDYADIWRGADKIVYSTTLTAVSSMRTRIAPIFDPAEIREMKASAEGDLSVGGPTLAAEAVRSGLVDECHLLLAPVLVGGGVRALPDGPRLELGLLDERSFRSGFVRLRYRTTA